MILPRLVSAATAASIVVGASLVVAGPAHANVSVDPEALAAQAQAAAEGADLAFVEARWGDVVSKADAFDTAYAAIMAVRDAAEQRVADAEAASAAADAAVEDAVGARDEARAAVDAARAALEAARDAEDDARDALDAARAALAAAPAAIANAENAVATAQDALNDADSDLADAVDAHDDAIEAFHAPISAALGAPSWWTSLNDRPVKVSDLSGSIEQAQATVATRQAAVDAAQASYNSATGLAKIAAGIVLTAARTALSTAQTRVSLLNQAYVAVDGPAREQAVADTAAALEAAEDAQAAAADDLSDAQDNLAALEDAVPGLEDAVATAKAAFRAAQADVDAKRAELDDARGLLDEAQAVLGSALTDADVAASELEDAQADLEAIETLIAALAAAVQSVADRRADLVDLDTVKRTVVWTLGADNETPRVGDTVKLNFTVPNSELFALSGAKVRVVTPSGVTPTCDIVDGVVAAGALVSCSATYVPTEADAKAGEVVFEVELTGFIPLGPGNPRSQAVTQTLITSTESIAVPVAAGLVAEAPADDEVLATTGSDTGALGVLAAAMVIAGIALIVVRRRFDGAAI